jgi:Amt family ammonium transporter
LTLGTIGQSWGQEAAAPPAEPAAAPAAEAPATPPAEAPAAPAAEAAPEAPAEPPPLAGSGDIAFMLICTLLVLMMTAPGLFLFYGGLVRKKNVLSVFMQCLFLCGINSIIWMVVGYSIAFGETGPKMFTSGELAEKYPAIQWFGGWDKVMLKGVEPYLPEGSDTPVYKRSHIWANVPELLFMVFQMMFYIITPALICGAFAERMKFSAMVVYTVLWGLLIYCPLAHWVWSGTTALLASGPYPGLDFAGGLVVHASSGISALVCALFLGKRLGYGKEPIVPHNLTYTAIGAALLWVGWFGFNAGSEIAADERAVATFVATHIAAAAALLSWSLAEWVVIGKPSVLGACSGLVAGLVVITPASGYVTPSAALIMGLAAGVICFIACAKIKPLFGYDDSLDAFGVHGVGGITGAILTGVFASEAIMGRGKVPENLVINQLVGVGVTAVYAIVGSVILLSLISVTIGLRVSPEDEIEGLDVSEHGESGYVF